MAKFFFFCYFQVYKNTTEPSSNFEGTTNNSLWFSNENIKNKFFSQGKLNEFFDNFGGGGSGGGGSKKNLFDSTESVKNVLITSNQNLSNC